MKRHVTLLILVLMTVTMGFAQDIDSLFNIYKDAPRKGKVEAAKPLMKALIADEVANERDTLALQGDLDNLTATLYNCMSMHHYALGNYAETLAYAEEGLPFVPDDSITMRSSYYSIISVMAFYMNDFQKALDACQQRLSIIPDDDKVNRASVCNTLASIYNELAGETSQKDSTAFMTYYYEQALHFSEEAVALRREMGNDGKGLLAAFLGKQSEILTQMMRFEEALTVVEEAMALDLEAERMNRYYQRLVQKGNILFGEERYPEAVEVYNEALEHTDKSQNSVTYCTILFQLGVSEQHLNDNKTAIAHLEEYYAMQKEMGTSHNALLFVALANCYRSIDPAKAYDYLVKYTAVCDSLRNAELMAQLNEFQTKYETAEKERQIAEQQSVIERRDKMISIWAIIAVILIVGIAVIAWLAVRYRHRGRELQRLNDTKSRLFSIISHDLKNPVQAQKRVIDVMANGVMMGKLTPADVQQSCTMLKQSSDSVNDMLLNLLQWASLEMGKTTCTPTRLDLNTVIAPVASQLQLQAKQKDIAIKVAIPEGTCVTADSNLLQTIVRNLISNAIKFSNAGSTVDVQAAADDNGCRLSITDHGVGMSEEKAQSLFSMSTRSSAGTSGEKGTGLGLFVCQELARRMGTAIEVKSHIGEGSCFSLKLSE